jgi:glycosyltransferase involved in cell wall biosynthesis
LIDIIIVRSNPIIYDVRVEKIARSLGKKYSISVLGWNRDGFSKKIIDKYFVPLKVFNLKAPYGKKLLVALFPLFWTWVLINLCFYKPRVVHTCDLDTFLPCYIYKLFFRKKIVFDVFDRYAMAYISPKLTPLYSIVNLLEELSSKESDLLITVTEKALRTFRRRPKHCTVIMNCSEKHNISTKKLQKNINFLSLLYTGTIHRNRGLKQITTAIRDIDNVELTIIGPIIHKEVLHEILKERNVKYRGFVERKNYLEIEASSDALVILYDLNLPNNTFTSPNKIFEAMSFGLPIITNMEQELVKEINCGILVKYDDINQIKAAVLLLRDNVEIRRTLGINGHKAFLERYNWGIMEQELYNIYEVLFKNSVTR